MAKLRDTDGEGWPPRLAVFNPADWPEASTESRARWLWRSERISTARQYGQCPLAELRAQLRETTPARVVPD